MSTATRNSPLVLALVLVLGIGQVSAELMAQEESIAQEVTQEPTKEAILEKALKKMTSLNSLTFSTTEFQDSATSRQFAKRVGGMGFGGGDGDKVVSGSWSDGILLARLNDDEDEVVSYRGRMLARDDDSEWKFRRNRLVNGSPLPFVLDPSHFFEALKAMPKSALRIRQAKSIRYREMDLTILSLTLEDEVGQDFALSGAIPPVASGFGGGMIILRGLGGIGAAQQSAPEVTVDLALYVDPKTGFVHKVRTRSNQKSSGTGNTVFRIQGAGLGEEEDEEEEEEVKEKDEQGNRIYKRGLPQRRLKDGVSRMDYTLTLTKHGHPVEINLDARAKRMLRLGGR